MGLVELETKEAFDTVLANAGDKLVVVDCFATWCGPCKKLAPQLEELATEYSNVQFYKLDVEVNEDVAADHNISAMPTILFYKNGKFLGDFCGANFEGIKDTIDKLV